MSRRHLAFALLLAALAVPTAPARGASSAIGAGGIAAGSIEFSPTVTFSHSNFRREGYGNVETSTQLTASPTLGYCVSDHWEVTGGLLMRHHSENGVSDTALGASAGLGYNFSPQGAFIPFASVGFGALFYDGFSMDETAVLAPTTDRVREHEPRLPAREQRERGVQREREPRGRGRGGVALPLAYEVGSGSRAPSRPRLLLPSRRAGSRG
jgi:hypothetical protein